MCISAPLLCFFFNDTATTEIYPLSLHDALPISNFPLQPLLRKAQRVDEFFEFCYTADHARSIDHQLTDCIHHAVKAGQCNSNGLYSWSAACGLFCGLLRRSGDL